jgi:hypothetical protein
MGRSPHGHEPRSRSIIPSERKNTRMLMTIAILLLVLYALGLVTSYTMGGLIHILLVAAVVIVLVRLIQGRPVA